MDGKRNIRHFFILSFALMLFAGQWQAYGEGRVTREHVFNKLEFANDSFPNAFKRLASDYTKEQRQKQKKLLCYTIVDNTIFYINCPLNAIPDFFEVTERACPLPLIPSGVETLEELDRGKPSYADLFLLTRAYCSNAGMGGEWRLNACSGRQPYSDLELPLYVDVPRQAFSH